MNQSLSLRQLTEIPSKCGFLKKVFLFQDFSDKDQDMLSHLWKSDFMVGKTIKLCKVQEIWFHAQLTELWEISVYWMNSKAWISLSKILKVGELEMKKATASLEKFQILVSRNKEKEIGKMLWHAILNHHNLIFGVMQITIFHKLLLNKLII